MEPVKFMTIQGLMTQRLIEEKKNLDLKGFPEDGRVVEIRKPLYDFLKVEMDLKHFVNEETRGLVDGDKILGFDIVVVD